jgi:hypothetical protein
MPLAGYALELVSAEAHLPFAFPDALFFVAFLATGRPVFKLALYAVFAAAARTADLLTAIVPTYFLVGLVVRFKCGLLSNQLYQFRFALRY